MRMHVHTLAFRRASWLLCGLPLLLALTLRAAPEAAALPETNPYHAAVARLQAIPPAERATLNAWVHETSENPAPPLSPAQTTLLRALDQDLRAAAASPPTTEADWLPAGHDPSAKLPEHELLALSQNLRELSRFTAKFSDTLPPSEAIETCVAIARLGRQQRTLTSIFFQMTGSGLENGTALEHLARRLRDFSPDELEHLSAAWSDRQPTPDLSATFRTERDHYFVPMIEEHVLSGLKKLETEALAHAGLATSPAAGFEDLRLSALVDLGRDEHRISLENLLTGDTFTLEKGRAVEGVLLVSVDFTTRQAVIRRNDRDARIDLRSRQITTARLSLSQIDAYLASNTVLDAEGKTFLRAALTHPEGPEGFVADLIAAYDTQVARQVAAASDAIASPPSITTETDLFAPFIQSSAKTYGESARRLFSTDLRSTMLQAAIHARLRELGREPATPSPADPWAAESGGDFELSTTEDGGLVLRSRYQRTPGNATAYKFGSPDAGPVRTP